MATYSSIISTALGGSNTGTTSTSNNDQYVDEDLKTIQENAKRQLQNQYDELIRQKVNSLNSRGAFGTSIANEDIGKTNYALGQSLAELAAQSAEQRLAQQDKNLAQSLAEKQLQQQQSQFEANLEYQRENAKRQAEQQLKQQQLKKFEDELKTAQVQQALNPDSFTDYISNVLWKYRSLLS